MGFYKHTLEFIREKLKEYGYELIDDKYINAVTKLTFKDDKGFYYCQSYNGFDSNKNPLRYGKSNPYTIKNIKLWVHLNNKPLELLSENYVTNNIKLKWRCLKEGCNQIFESSWQNIYSNRGCNKCSKNKKFTYDEVKSFVEVENNSGVKLLSKEYVGCEDAMDFQCKCGNKYQTTFRSFKFDNKRQCNDCCFLMIAESRRKSYDEVKNFIEVESGSGCTLLSENYTTNSDALYIQCKCGNTFYDTYAHFRESNSSKACEVCSNKIRWDIHKMQYWCDTNAYGYQVLETFRKNNKVRTLYVKIQCPNENHKPYKTAWSNFYAHNKRCKQCFSENHSGENHHNWNGGITAINGYIRCNIVQWKKDSIKNSNFQCIITGKPFNVIHHLYGFNMILDETFNELNITNYTTIGEYSLDELKTIGDKCLELHYKYPLGVCLTDDIHTLFHSLYGRKNNTPEQFDEFKKRYFSGEFECKEGSTY